MSISNGATMHTFQLFESDQVRAKWTSSSPFQNPPSILIEFERSAILQSGLKTLRDVDRLSLLACCHYDDCPSVRELCNQWHCKPQCIYYRRDRALRQLRRFLAFR